MLMAGPAAPSPALANPPDTGEVVLEGAARSEVEGLRTEAEAVREQIDELDRELEVLTEEYNRTALALEDSNQSLTELRRSLRLATAAYHERRDLLDRRLISIYKAGGDGMVKVLLASDGLGDFVSRLYLVTRVAVHDTHLIADLEEEALRVEELQGKIEERKEEQLRLRGDLRERRDGIESRLAEREDMLGGLDDRVAVIIEEEKRRQEAERLRLEEELRAQLSGWEAYDGPLPETEDTVLNQVVETAATYLGIPYVWGGEYPGTGFDCSGLTRYVFRQHGVEILHYSGYQAQAGAPVPPNRIQTGDLVAFGSPVHHVGIYIGDDKFIHAPRTGDVVRITPLSSRNDLTAVRRFAFQPRQGPPLLD